MGQPPSAPAPDSALSWLPTDGGAPLPIRWRITVWLDSEGHALSGSAEKFLRGNRLTCDVVSADGTEGPEELFLELLPTELLDQPELPFS